MKVLLTAVLTVAALSSGSVVQPPADTFELLILHNNDMHARFEQTSQLSGTCTTADREAGKCYGGFPRVAHVVKEARQAAHSGQGPPVLYLNAGDTYTGTAWFTIYKWKIAAEFINALQPDAVSLGNHEFDDGVSGLTPFIRNLTCPVLAANIILTKEPELGAEPNLMNSIVLDINDTLIGVIGYLTPETKLIAVKNNVEYIDEITAVRKEAAMLKSKGVHILIALGHSGLPRDLEVAREVEDIDLVIGAHTNTFLWNGSKPDGETPEGLYPTIVKQESGRLVPVVQAYAYTKYLGKLIIKFNSYGEMIDCYGNPILLDKTIPQDSEILKIVNYYHEHVYNISEQIIGKTLAFVDGGICRLKECNMGNFITDAMVYKYASMYKGKGWTDAPVAIVHSGGIRSSFSPDLPSNITKGDLLRVLPFDGIIVKITIDGHTILKMLEYCIHNYNPSNGAGQFLQISGMRVIYDLNRPPNERVQKVTVQCGECLYPEYFNLNKTKEYKILLPTFLANGGDGFNMFNGLTVTNTDLDEIQCTEEYIKSHSPLYPAVEGRIKFQNLNVLDS